MFRSAVLKLTIYYLTILMIISIGFSLLLFRISSNELERGLRRPESGIFGSINQLRYDDYRQNRLDEAHDSLLFDLVIFNLLVLTAGGLLSVILASKTLEPIEKALTAQSRFAADASHELRTPLTAMQTEIEVALRQPNLKIGAAKQQLQSNLEEVVNLRGLVEGLLVLARSNKNGLQLTNTNLEDVGIDAITRVVKTAQAKHISIDNTIGPVQVMADRQLITEAVVILLDNAIKYSPEKSEISLSGQTQGKTIQLQVRDKGPGIKPADLPQVFDRFYQSDSSRTKNQAAGYGLGLSIAKQIVDLHHGKLTVSSQVGQGSTFSISLPAIQATS